MARDSLYRVLLIGILGEPTACVCDRRYLQGILHVEQASARTTKQFPAVPSGNTTVEQVRLLGPRAKKERSRRITAVCGKASMIEGNAEVHYRVVGGTACR